MKKIFIGILILCLIITVFAACNGGDSVETTDPPVSSDVTEAPITESENNTEPESTPYFEETSAPEETTTPVETTTPEETTTPPEPDHGPSEGLEYKAFGDYAILAGIGTCTDKDVVIATHFNGVPVTEIWHEAFSGVKGMTSVTIPEGVTFIESSAFKNCPDLRAVYLPSTLTNIAGSLDFGFINCPAIEVIEMAQGNTKYYSVGNCLIEKATGTLVFGGGKSVIPTDGSVKSIGAFAFNGNKALKNIVIPEGVTDIHTSAFAGCAELESITLPQSLKSIRQWAFDGCSSLVEVKIPDGVGEIYQGAFRDCAKLKDVTLPKALTLLDSEAFEGCAIESITIPEGVKELGAVFAECKELKSVALPEGFEGFVGNTFAGCTSLESLTLPKTLKRIGMFTFYNCTALKELRFTGTAAEWDAVAKQERWKENAAFDRVKCTDADAVIPE